MLQGEPFTFGIGSNKRESWYILFYYTVIVISKQNLFTKVSVCYIPNTTLSTGTCFGDD